jgi:predicted membrane-bound spermidine synthase
MTDNSHETPAVGRQDSPTHYYIEIFAVAAAALLLEVCYTRVFSFKLFYFYTYLIIGIALLGLGGGGVAVTIFSRIRETPLRRLVPPSALMAGLTTGLGYVAVAGIRLDTLSFLYTPGSIARLVVVCLAVFVPYFFVGLIFSSVFGRAGKDVNRLYAVDLVGAAAGCALAVPFMNLLSPPGCVMLCGAAFCLAAVRSAAGAVVRSTAIAGAAVLLCLAGIATSLPDPVVDSLKTMGAEKFRPETVLHTEWNAVFRIDVLKSGGYYGEKRRIIAHDGLIGSTLHRWDGTKNGLARFDREARALPFRLAKPNPKILIIGSAGGHEILAATYFDASDIKGVELNPATVALLTDHFKDYTGNLAGHENVRVINDEGRSYLERDAEKYDIIFFVAPDTYSAMNAATSAAFVLSESYLYTKEMVKTAFEHLAPDGVVCMQFGEVDYDSKPNRTARYIVTARAALAEMGIDEFDRHIMHATDRSSLTLSTILLRAEPFTEDQIARFEGQLSVIPQAVSRHVPGHESRDSSALGETSLHPVELAIHLDDDALATWLDEYAYDVSVVVDDRPFFWHFVRFSDVWAGNERRGANAIDFEHAVGERTLTMIIALAAVMAGVLLLVPFFVVREQWSAFHRKTTSLVYFSCLGFGFMLFEISLIQQLSLFLGYPTYSLSVTLATILVASGIGSFLAEKFVDRARTASVALLGALAALTIIYLVFGPAMIDRLIVLPLAVRIVIAIAAIAPLGLCLGGFMPMGLAALTRLAPSPEQYIAWSWAINGFFSVIGSVGTTILSMIFGFRVVLVLGLATYTIAVLALRRLSADSS